MILEVPTLILAFLLGILTYAVQQQVVVQRRDQGVRAWEHGKMEDISSHQWLGLDLFFPLRKGTLGCRIVVAEAVGSFH